MKVLNLFIFVPLLCCFITKSVVAQEPFFERYTTENGISQNSGYAIEQTPEGFIWIGTQNGLDRYDSHSFVNYKHNGNNNSLCNNFITALCTDYAGNLWVGTQKGISIYNRFTNKFYSPSVFYGNKNFFTTVTVKRIKKVFNKPLVWIITKENGACVLNTATGKINFFFTEDSIRKTLRSIVTDEEGNTWINTEKDIYQYKNETFIPLHVKQENKITNTAMLQEMIVYQQQLWIGSINQGIFTLNIKSDANNILHKLNTTEYGINIDKEITQLYKDKKNNIWIGTPDNGLFEMNLQSKKINHYKYNSNNASSISSNYILSLFEDAQGIIWIGTSGGGISKYDKQKILFAKYTLTNTNASTSNMVLSMYNTKDSCVYVGTLAGGFIKTNLLFTHQKLFKNNIANKHSLLHNTIYGITSDESGLIWLATKAGLCSYNPNLPDDAAFNSYAPGNNGPEKFFYSIIKLQKENALLVSGYNGIFKFNINTKKWTPINDNSKYTTINTIVGRYMIELPNNHLLICTEGLGLIDYNYQKGIFSTISTVNSVSNNIRHALLYNNQILLATDNGLIIYDYNKNKIISIFNKHNLLIDNVVYSTMPGVNNSVWISTNTGLAKINLQLNTCKYYDVSYGLQSMEFNTACCFAATNGILYFGGINGINSFLPATIPEKFYIAPAVITSITVMNKPLVIDSNVSYIHTITLPYNNNFIDINFSTTNFSHSEKNIYAYRLLGVDASWVNSGKRNTAIYTQLHPGSYQFIIKAINNNGDISSTTQSINITITPPWWQTWWAKAIWIFMLCAFIYFIAKYQIKKIQHTEAIKTRLKEYELKALHAQMNPHFIFNCLASIKQMILDNDKTNANKYLNKFSILIRQTLEHSKQSFITLKQNNEYLIDYLEMEQLRFNGYFSYTFIIEPDIDEDDYLIPPMMMQPLVENAIWHGLMPAKQKGEIKIIYKRKTGKLLCIVDDNGVGINLHSKNKKSYNSYGIQNLQQRLLLMQEAYKKEYSLTIINKSQIINSLLTGTEATLLITQL